MLMKANEEPKSRKNYPDFFVDAPYCTRQFWATLFRSLIKGGRGKGGGGLLLRPSLLCYTISLIIDHNPVYQ